MGDELPPKNDNPLFGAAVPGMPEKPPPIPEHDEENPMGGEMFRKMMEKAQQGPNRPASVQEAYPSPSAAVPPPTAAAPAAPAVAPDQMAYYQQQLKVWQEQMTAYAQFSAANPEAAKSMTMPPPPPPPPAMAATPPPPAEPAAPLALAPDLESDPSTVDPKAYVPQGSGNKDAYEITNPADVYFAQLKRDSYVRTTARKEGDLDTANKPFADVGVKALNNILSDELIAQRREQLQQNGGEFETSRDEMLIPYSEEEEEVDKTYAGISYKQKLEEMKKKKAARASGNAPVASAPVAPAPAPVVEPVAVAAAPAPVVEEPKPVETEEDEGAEEKPNFALETSENFDDSKIDAPSMEDTEETRKKIRTLMGLILKHRGGPGFGAGRLKDDEFKKLVDSVKEVTDLLRSEAGLEVASNFEEASASIVAPSSPTSSALEGSIACAEAALGLYKSSDPSVQGELLEPVRDALESALKIINNEIKDPMKSSVSAVAPTPDTVYATTMDFPDTYKVTKPEVEEETVVESVVDEPVVDEPVAAKPVSVKSDGTDENTKILQGVYDKLKNVAGDGKYGLRDIEPDEVSSIKDALLDMRGVMMDELDNGIPN
jgi:hypothetical protein